jgi:hypothetical protein
MKSDSEKLRSQKIFGHCCNITYLAVTTKNKIVERIDMKIQGVSEISTLILTGNRTHQKEQLFSLPFWRKTLRSGLKK